jgi:hypothetical protein
MHLRRDSGQVTILVAISMPVFCGFLGLALDVGSFYTSRQRMQSAADASARAAILELKRGSPETMLAAATAAADANGFSSGLDMNFPPESGPNVGNTNFVEVIIDGDVPTVFARMLIPETSAQVRARAVAGLSAIPPAGIYVLNRTEPRALEVGTESSVTSGLGVWVSSSHHLGLSVTGASSLTAPAIGVTGGFEGAGYSEAPLTGMIPDADPLAHLPAPASGGACNFVNTKVQFATETLNPGVYCRGIIVSTNGRVTLRPGVYVLRGTGLDVNNNAFLAGTGVTIYNTGDATFPAGPVLVRGNATMQVSAPTSGSLAGVAIFFDRALPLHTANMQVSTSGDTTIEGAVYAPTQRVELLAGTTLTQSSPWMLMVADMVRVLARSQLRVPADFANSDVPSPIRTAVTVE